MDHEQRRLHRQLRRMEHRLPRMARGLTRLTDPDRRALRLPVALGLIAGGMLGFLPILGFWMIPLGLLLLAIDLPFLRPVISALIIRLRRWLRHWRFRL
ncbi:MAG: tryptophan synthase subunit beta [Pararhodobacter sp.]|nr:tryptophan synthase subunit beta [Pararhodobacter sp.]